MNRAEAGFVGGVEVLPFGVLVFVLGTLLVANAWAVVDAKLAVESAAREAGRAYVEAGSAATAGPAADRAARQAMEGMGRDGTRLRLTTDAPAYVRCGVVDHETSYDVPTLHLPVIGGLGPGFTVRGHHREIVEPFAAGYGRESRCGY